MQEREYVMRRIYQNLKFFKEPTYDVEHLEDRFHQFSRKKLKTEIESIRQACDKIALQGKVLVNEMKRKWQPDKAMQKNIQLKIPIKANTKVQICELNGTSDLEKNRNQYIWQPNKAIEPHIKLQLAKERYSFKHQIKRVHQNMKISKETHECNVQIEKELKEREMTKINRENDMHSEKDGMFDSGDKEYKLKPGKFVGFSRIKNSSEVESEAEMNITSYEEDPKVPNSVQDFGQYSTSEPFTIHRRRNAGEHIPDFRCIICELEFDFMDDMNYHMERHHKMKCIRKSFSCISCVDDIPDWFQMSIDRDQGEIKPKESQNEAASATFSCKICNHTCKNIELLHKHIHSNHHFDFESIKTLCSYCRSQLSETVYEVCTLTNDLCPSTENPKIHSDAKSHLCKICNVPCKDEAEVNLHRELHLPGKGCYRCLKCDKTFKKVTFLENHVWMHYDKTPFRCIYCAEYKNRNTCLYYHELIHLPESQKKFECNQCQFRTWTKIKLAMHVKNTHSDKRYHCNLCPAIYKNKPEFLYHKMKKHNGQFRFTCDICGAGAVTQRDLNRHKESHENIRCPVCSKKLFCRIRLHEHMKNVHGCTQCDKRFRTPGSLNIHKRHHSGIKEHACTYCEKAFYTSTNLQDHIRIHTGEKPFKCVVCQKAFAKSCNLKKHKKLLNH